VLDVGQGGTPGPTVLGPTVLGAIAAGAGYNYAAMPAYTILTAFKVKGIPQGARVVVTCKGRSCPKARFTIKGAGIKPVKPLSKRRLKVGTVIEIRITKPGYIGRVVQIRIRARKAPSAKQLCLPVGTSKAVACS
jgi:hypothetical protein